MVNQINHQATSFYYIFSCNSKCCTTFPSFGHVGALNLNISSVPQWMRRYENWQLNDCGGRAKIFIEIYDKEGEEEDVE